MESDNNKAGKRLKATLSFAAVAVMLLVAVSPLMIGDDVSAESDGEWISPFTKKIDRQLTVPSGYIGIFSPEDLTKIGTGVDSIYDDPEDPGEKLKWTMDAKYIQMCDLDFTGVNLNGGFDVRVTVTTGADLVIKVEYDLGFGYADASGVNVWIEGKRFSANSSGVATYAGYDSSNEYVIIIGGNPGSNELTVAFVWNDNMQSILIKDSNGNVDPIGDMSFPFNGTYDGNGYTINGADLAGYSSGNLYMALFRCFTSEAEIRNLGIKGGSSVGVSSSNAEVANLAGAINTGSGPYPDITNCYNDSFVFGAGSSAVVGGICARGMVPINCSNGGTIVGFAESSGMLVGGVGGSIPGTRVSQNCYNTGYVMAILQLLLHTCMWVVSEGRSHRAHTCHSTQGQSAQ